MPTNRKRRTRVMRDKVNADVKTYLMTGEMKSIDMFLTGAEERLYELWQLNRDRLLSACKPFERPYGFYYFDLKKSLPEDQKAFLKHENLLSDKEIKLLAKEKRYINED